MHTLTESHGGKVQAVFQAGWGVDFDGGAALGATHQGKMDALVYRPHHLQPRTTNDIMSTWLCRVLVTKAEQELTVLVLPAGKPANMPSYQLKISYMTLVLLQAGKERLLGHVEILLRLLVPLLQHQPAVCPTGAWYY